MRANRRNTNEQPQVAVREEPPPPPLEKKLDKKKELVKEIATRAAASVAGNVGELMVGRAARRMEAGIAQNDRFSTGIKLKPKLGTLVEYKKLGELYKTAAVKTGVLGLASGILTGGSASELKKKLGVAGNILGGAVGIAAKDKLLMAKPLGLAQTALDNIMKKGDYSAVLARCGKQLEVAKNCWKKGDFEKDVKLEKADVEVLKKCWTQVEPHVTQLHAAVEQLQSHVPHDVPAEHRWGDAAHE